MSELGGLGEVELGARKGVGEGVVGAGVRQAVALPRGP